jgi:Uma2 family endonuclease
MLFPLEERKYTYADYLSWQEDERVEIIDGIPYYTYGGEIVKGASAMQATPSQAHQIILGEIFLQLRIFLSGKPCRAYLAPFAVRLNAADNGDTTVEPDIIVVCDSSKVFKRGINGAPDLVVEILLPSTSRKDRHIKFNKYQQAGVRECWIVDPDTKLVEVSVLENSRYFTSVYSDTETIPVTVLPGCQIVLSEVFIE